MKEKSDAKGEAQQKREQADPEYPDVIMPVGPEDISDEESPMAFSLLSTIKDPYYAKKGLPGFEQSASEDGIAQT